MATLIILLRLIDIHSDHVLQFLNVILLYKVMVQPLQMFPFFLSLSVSMWFYFPVYHACCGSSGRKLLSLSLTCLCEPVDVSLVFYHRLSL